VDQNEIDGHDLYEAAVLTLVLFPRVWPGTMLKWVETYTLPNPTSLCSISIFFFIFINKTDIFQKIIPLKGSGLS
jgi:hypothetical protein